MDDLGGTTKGPRFTTEGEKPAKDDRTAPALLSLAEVTMAFGGLTALDRVSFAAREGEILGLIGPNGAGKTTLFNVIAAVFPPASGAVAFRGESLRGLSPHRVAAKGIARTFQNIRLFPDMTVEENVMVGRHGRGRAGAWAGVLRTRRQRDEERSFRTRTEELLALVGLEGANALSASALPYGHQRRLEIARALAADPTLLLLDEPAAGMNESETMDIHRLIGRIRDGGVTVVLIEHDMSLVMRLCDRLVVLNFGRKIAEGAPAEIREDPVVIEAYLGRDEGDRLA